MNDAIYKKKGLELEKLNKEYPLELWFYEMVQKKETELTIRDISHMLCQEVYLDIAIPIAWKRIIDDPFSGEFYDGHMIKLLTRVFADNPELKQKENYITFNKKVKKICEIYEWESDYEKQEYEKILIEFRSLFV